MRYFILCTEYNIHVVLIMYVLRAKYNIFTYSLSESYNGGVWQGRFFRSWRFVGGIRPGGKGVSVRDLAGGGGRVDSIFGLVVLGGGGLVLTEDEVWRWGWEFWRGGVLAGVGLSAGIFDAGGGGGSVVRAFFFVCVILLRGVLPWSGYDCEELCWGVLLGRVGLLGGGVVQRGGVGRVVVRGPGFYPGGIV